MIKRTDWEAAHRDLVMEGRRKLGDLPADDDLLAFSRGELREEEASRIRELLCHDPEIARALVVPFPTSEDEERDDPGVIQDDVIRQDWAALEARLAAEPPAPAPAAPLLRWLRWLDPGALLGSSLWRWRLSTAMALGMAGVLGLLAFQARTDVERLTRELAEPRVPPAHRLLLPDGLRGAEEAPITLPAGTESFLLTLAVADHPPCPTYRVRIVEVDGTTETEIWSASMPRPEDNVFAIWAPRAFLKSPAPHRLDLYGVRNDRPHRLAAYTIQLSAGGR